MSGPRGAEPGMIVISAGQVAAIAENFTATWRRPPSRQELDGLIRDRVQEEVYYREAMALGLDKDDTVIRRRLRQKLEFLTDDVAALATPTDDDLRAYLLAHPESFRVQRRFTFRHVYLSPGRHAAHLAADAAALLAQLEKGAANADVATLGDPFLLDHAFTAVPAGEVEALFGQAFAAKLGEVRLGQWQGPLESGYGVHLVFVDERTEGHVPPLAEIREAVGREWAEARRREAKEKLYGGMLERYQVSVEAPAAEPKAVADVTVR